MLWLKNILTKIMKAPQKQNTAQTISLSEGDFPSPHSTTPESSVSIGIGTELRRESCAVIVLPVLPSTWAGRFHTSVPQFPQQCMRRVWMLWLLRSFPCPITLATLSVNPGIHWCLTHSITEHELSCIRQCGIKGREVRPELARAVPGSKFVNKQARPRVW